MSRSKLNQKVKLVILVRSDRERTRSHTVQWQQNQQGSCWRCHPCCQRGCWSQGRSWLLQYRLSPIQNLEKRGFGGLLSSLAVHTGRRDGEDLGSGLSFWNEVVSCVAYESWARSVLFSDVVTMYANKLSLLMLCSVMLSTLVSDHASHIADCLFDL
jgi:hypothetical protein